MGSEQRFDDSESLRWIWRPVAVRGGNLLVAELHGKLGRKVLGFGTTRLGHGALTSRLVLGGRDPASLRAKHPLRVPANPAAGECGPRWDSLLRLSRRPGENRQLICHGAPVA